MATNLVNLHPFDAQLMLREAAAGNLTASANTGAKKVYGLLRKGLAVQIVIPQAAGTSPTLKADVQTSATEGGTYTTVASHGPAYTPDASGEVLIIPFAVPAGAKWVRIAFTAGGTSPNFGAVVAGIIPNPGGNYDRQEHWE